MPMAASGLVTGVILELTIETGIKAALNGRVKLGNLNKAPAFFCT
jgi:hypothetical protein